MRFCCENNFDILLTIDKNLMHQQNMDKYPLTIVVLNCVTSTVAELILFIPSLNHRIILLEKHQAYIIDK